MIKKERIAKFIARAGHCSRREAERLIVDGKVTVDGESVITPVFFVSSKNKIVVEGTLLNKHKKKTKLFLYNKPQNLLCSSKSDGDKNTIYQDLSNYNLPRLIYVGRLDFKTEGLLLLTTDGYLSKILTDSSLGLNRTYKVRAFGDVSQNDLDQLAFGLDYEGIKYKPIIASIIRRKSKNTWIEFTIKEGKNREIRKICEYLGLQVSRLIRVKFGPFNIEEVEGNKIIEVSLERLKNIIPPEDYHKLLK